MSFVFSVRSRERLGGVHPDLRFVIGRALQLSPVDFSVVEGARSIERQRELVAAGASQTMASRHITGHAVDLAPWVAGQIRWDGPLYLQIAEAVQQASRETKIPIRWGGAWARLDATPLTPAQLLQEYVSVRHALGQRPFIDQPHFELPKDQYP